MRSIFYPRGSVPIQKTSRLRLSEQCKILSNARLLPKLHSSPNINHTPALITELPQIQPTPHTGIKRWLSLVKGKRIPYEKYKSNNKSNKSEESITRDTKYLIKRLSERNELYKKEYSIHKSLNALNGSLIKLDRRMCLKEDYENPSKRALKWYDSRPKLIVNKYYKNNYTPISTSPKVFKYKKMTVAELWHSVSLLNRALEMRSRSVPKHFLLNNRRIRLRPDTSMKLLVNSFKNIMGQYNEVSNKEGKV